MRETKEEFLARYPQPNPKRVLVSCECDYTACTGWAWTWLDYLAPWETIVEDN